MSISGIVDIPLFTSQECAELASFVDELRDRWLPYGSNPEFPYYHVIPTAMYYRAARGEIETYESELHETNRLLSERFGSAYARIGSALSDLLGEPVRLSDEAAYPGFHLYQVPMPNAGKVHVDDQHTRYPWRNPDEWDMRRAISATLVLQLPESGGGLKTWEGHPLSSAASVARYEIGHLYAFSSFRHHQVAASPEMRAGERRLTMQAHALFNRSGFWSLYW